MAGAMGKGFAVEAECQCQTGEMPCVGFLTLVRGVQDSICFCPNTQELRLLPMCDSEILYFSSGVHCNKDHTLSIALIPFNCNRMKKKEKLLLFPPQHKFDPKSSLKSHVTQTRTREDASPP